jgi:hypothetical protein
MDATHGIADEGDSRSSDKEGGWRPMNFIQTILLALLANPLVFQQAIIP